MSEITLSIVEGFAQAMAIILGGFLAFVAAVGIAAAAVAAVETGFGPLLGASVVMFFASVLVWRELRRIRLSEKAPG